MEANLIVGILGLMSVLLRKTGLDKIPVKMKQVDHDVRGY
jgi:hypothetical protein